MTADAPPRFRFRDIFATSATASRFVAVVGLQMGQIFPQAFFSLILTAIYRENGLPLHMFWVFTLPAVPTWLRPLWAPLVDGRGSPRLGLRRSWFIPCTLFGALAYMSLALFAPTLEDLWIIITILVIKATFMTTQDIAIDGYMVENIEDRERGVASALIDIGRNVAQFTAFGFVVWVYGAFGWGPAVHTAAALLLLFSLPGMLRAEPPPPPHAVLARARGERPSLLRLLRRPDSRVVLPLIAAMAFAGSMIPSLYIAYLVDMGFSVGEIGPKVLAPTTLIGTVLGASLTVAFLNRFGFRATLLTAAVLMVPTVLPIIWLGTLEQPTLANVFLVTLNGIMLPTFYTVAMQGARLKWASRTQAATDYTTQIVVMQGSAAAALAVGGVLAEWLGWMWYFALAGGLTCLMCTVTWALYRHIEALVDARDRAELDPATAAPTLPA